MHAAVDAEGALHATERLRKRGREGAARDGCGSSRLGSSSPKELRRSMFGDVGNCGIVVSWSGGTQTGTQGGQKRSHQMELGPSLGESGHRECPPRRSLRVQAPAKTAAGPTCSAQLPQAGRAAGLKQTVKIDSQVATCCGRRGHGGRMLPGRQGGHAAGRAARPACRTGRPAPSAAAR